MVEDPETVERQGQRYRTRRVVETPDRGTAARLKAVVVGTLGTVLLLRGLRRRSLRGVAMALVGGWLVVRAVRAARATKGSGRAGRSGAESAGSGEEPKAGGRSAAADRATVSRSIVVGRSAEDCYDVWRDPEQFSRVVGNVADVTSIDDDRYEWTVDGPLDRTLSWETRIVDAEPGEYLRWKTTDGAPVPHEGAVRFEPAAGDRGTVVTVALTLDPPGGWIGATALRRIGFVPETLVGETLHRCKALAETGEFQTLSGNPSGRGNGDLV